MFFGSGVILGNGVNVTSILVDGVASSIAPLTVEETYTITPFTPILAKSGTGTPPYRYIVTNGTLPDGLILNSATGLVSGTTNLAQTVAPVTFAVQDSFDYTSPTTSTVNITVLSRITATAITTPLRSEATRTITPFQPLIAAGGNGVYTYSVTPSLPTGLTLNPSTGFVSGTPTVATAVTAYTFSVRDSLGITATTTSTINVTVYSLITAVATTTPQTFTSGVAITPFRPLLASNGTGTYTYSLAVGSVLPTGITLDPTTGYISGTTSQTNYGVVTVTIYVRDDLGITAATTAAVNLYVYVYITAIADATSSITSTVGIPISSFTPLTPYYGLAPYTYYYTGTLPAGLTYTNGVVSGTPTAASTGTVTFFVKDSLNNTASISKAVAFTVNAAISATANIVTQLLEVTVAMSAYTPLTAISGGTTPYTYYVATGTLPGGLSLDSSTGQITGTPTTAYGPSTVEIGVRDSLGATSATSAAVSFRVYPRITASGPDTGVQNLEVGVASANFMPIVASGGTGIYTYLSSVNLATYGLTFNTSTGMVSGTPTSTFSGTVSFTVKDSLNVLATKVGTHTYTIYPQLTASAVTTAQSYLIGTAITAYNPLTASGGTGTYTYSYTGTIPSGLAYNTSTGVLSGTPTARQTLSATFSVKDSLNITAATTSTVSFSTGTGPTTINYLVVAGGGGGGQSGPPGQRAGGGGGGGGGGYVSGSYVQNPGTVLTITVGGGGTAGSPGAGGNGTASSLTSATSATGGGGGGGWTPATLSSSGAGKPGGSGGGGTPVNYPAIPGGYSPTGGGSGSQGGNGGSSGASPGGAPFPNQAYGGGGGGGGGANAPGSNGTIGPSPSFNITWTGSGGGGGAGKTWSFTGATLYGGGGGGGGGIYLSPGPSGASNYGGGGAGGSSTTGASAAGYSGGGGVVILSVPTGSYSGVKTGGTTSNPPAAPGQTVITYTSSGNYTV